MEYKLGAEEFKDWCRMYPSSSEYKVWDKIISIDNWTFADCPQLKKLILPSKLVEIGYKAFENSNNIEEICFDNGENKSLNGQFTVENGYLYDAFSRTVLKVFSNAQVIEIPEGVKKNEIFNSGDVTPGDFGSLYGRMRFTDPDDITTDFICDELVKVVKGKKRSWENKKSIGFCG